MGKYLFAVLAAATMSLLLGCKGAKKGEEQSLGQAKSTAISIAHESGVTELPTVPQRLVVLEYSFIDALAALNVAPVGIADDKVRARIVPALTRHIGDAWVSVGTRKQPSIEVIASLRPDLIIADTKRHAAVYNSLSEVAPTIVLNSLGSDYEATIGNMHIIAKALGKEAALEKRLLRHQKVMDDYAAKFKNPEGLKAQFGVTNANGLWLHGPISFAASVLARLGYPSAIDNKKQASIATSLEQLAALNPDLLLLGKYAQPALTDRFPEDALWQTIAAVTGGRVYEVTAHTWSRLRGIIAAEMMAAELLSIMGS